MLQAMYSQANLMFRFGVLVGKFKMNLKTVIVDLGLIVDHIGCFSILISLGAFCFPMPQSPTYFAMCASYS